MWIIDIRHWLDENLMDAGLPQLRLKVKKLGEIISYATAIEAGIPVDFQPVCWRRPGRKACRGALEMELVSETNQIHWLCPECGDEGVVSGWSGLIWDMTDCSSALLH
jgi:RNA polymerase subunit RPABC4/transcription elongation factor Spt4